MYNFIYQSTLDQLLRLKSEPYSITKESIEYVSSLNDELYSTKEILDKQIEFLQKEVNLLKSLNLINNLNINTEDDNSNFLKSNYFINITKEENLSTIISNNTLFNNYETLHQTLIKIKVNHYLFSSLEKR